MTIASKFGLGRRARHKADEGDDTTSISDEANLWWTRGDFVQHAVVRNSTSPPAPPLHPGAASAGATTSADAAPGRSFSEVFTTESLYDAPDPARSGAAPRRDEPARPTPPTPPASEARGRLPEHHPLAEALRSLGLDGQATWSEVQHAYRLRAKEAHPDHSGDDGESMAELNATYTSLRNGRRYGLFGDD